MPLLITPEDQIRQKMVRSVKTTKISSLPRSFFPDASATFFLKDLISHVTYFLSTTQQLLSDLL